MKNALLNHCCFIAKPLQIYCYFIAYFVNYLHPQFAGYFVALQP
jgi:hypothetical protein